ncbi:MAG: DUF503 domain-containing protein [Chloroflexi bacterium]|nr:DUF503 domain-containing protein [Chloroflexota bacterium]
MHIGVCRISLRLAENHSLKGKRQVLRSLETRVRQRFNVAIAEVADQDAWQVGTIGFACVSNAGAHADQMMAQVVHFIEDSVRGDAEVLDVATEVIVSQS